MAFKKGDKFILELGAERKMFREFEIAGTDLYVKTDLLEKLTRLEPSAEPEQKIGHWIIRRWGDDARCSVCGRTFKDVYDMDNSDNYCRHCGTKMEGLING